MPVATLTSKGQVTIPKEVREALRLKQGDRLDFVVQDDGSIRVRPLTVDIRDLVGILKADRHVTIEEMNEAIRDGWTPEVPAMIAVDTNVVVRLLVEDDAEQTRIATRLLDHALASRAALFVSGIVLCETVWVLGSVYRFSRDTVADAVGYLLAAEQLSIENQHEAGRALAAFEAGEGDIADLLIRERARSLGAQAVATFDRALQRADGFVPPDPASWGDDLSLHEDTPRYQARRRLPVRTLSSAKP